MKLLQPGESTGYGRRFVAERPTWIGIVPVGYGDGFRRALTGTTVRVGGEPARVVGTVSMDSFAVELAQELPLGAPVRDRRPRRARWRSTPGMLGRSRTSSRQESRRGPPALVGLVVDSLSGSNDDAVRARFAANADRVAEASLRRLPGLEARLSEFVQPRGDERVLDVGTGTGPLAFVLAPHVREVVGIDLVPELLEHARAYAGDRFPNVQFLEGDVSHLDVETGAFDLVCERAVLHHVPRPELVLAEMTRAMRAGRPDARDRPARAVRPARRRWSSTASSGRAIRRTRACSPTATSERCSRRTRSS